MQTCLMFPSLAGVGRHLCLVCWVVLSCVKLLTPNSNTCLCFVFHSLVEWQWPYEICLVFQFFKRRSGDELWYTSNQLNVLFTTGKAGPVHLFKTKGSELKGSYQLGPECTTAPASGNGGWLGTWQVILLCSLGGGVLLVGIGYSVYRNNRRKDDGEKRYAATGSFAEGYISI